MSHVHSLFRGLLASLSSVLLGGCFLLGLGGGDDDEPTPDEPSPAVGLLASDGDRALLLKSGGLEPATAPFPTALSIRTLVGSRDRSRVVFSGVEADSEAHAVWVLSDGAMERIADDIVGVDVGPEARWVWITRAPDGVEVVELHRYDGGGEPVARGAPDALTLLGFGPADAYAVLRDGPMLRVVLSAERQVLFDPEMGLDFRLVAVRHDGLLLSSADGTAGTWFSLDGEAAGSEGTIPRLGYTLADGVLTHRTLDAETNVAEGLPDDIDEIVASDVSVVLCRRTTVDGTVLTFFDYAGEEIASYVPERVADVAGSDPPVASRITEVVPVSARVGVVVLEHDRLLDGGTAEPERYRTVHAYRLDVAGTLDVRLISERTASMMPGGFGYFAASTRVAWLEGDRVVAHYDTSSGETLRIDVDRAPFFEAHHSGAGRHH